jgi:hypothetical protein
LATYGQEGKQALRAFGERNLRVPFHQLKAAHE